MGWFKKLTGIDSNKIITTDPFNLQEKLGKKVEETFFPEKMNKLIADTPIIGDSASRGWMGQVVQGATKEGQEYVKDNLPERNLLKVLGEGEKSIPELKKKLKPPPAVFHSIKNLLKGNVLPVEKVPLKR
jgi:hypothetical protein